MRKGCVSLNPPDFPFFNTQIEQFPHPPPWRGRVGVARFNIFILRGALIGHEGLGKKEGPEAFGGSGPHIKSID